MIDFERIRAVKKSARERLRAIPGVHAVGIGAKVVAGQRTAEPAIAVFVVKKRPLTEVSPDEAVPTEIEGIKTDVIEMDLPRLLGAPGAPDYPTLLNVAIDNTDPQTIHITGPPETSGTEWVIKLEIELVDGSGTTSTRTFSVQIGGLRVYPLENAATRIMKHINQAIPFKSPVQLATQQGTDVTLSPPAGWKATFKSCVQTMTDGIAYRPLVGGIQIQARPVDSGSDANKTAFHCPSGTLGCILVDSTNPSTGVFALTNFHVVYHWYYGDFTNDKHNTPSPLTSTSTQVSATPPNPVTPTDPFSVSFNLLINTTTLPATIIIVALTIDDKHFNVLFWYLPSDPPPPQVPLPAIVSALMAEIIAKASNLVSVALDPTKTTALIITPLNAKATFEVKVQCFQDDVTTWKDLNSALTPSIKYSSQVEAELTFAGNVTGPDYGVYVTIDVGGNAPSDGIFVPVQAGATPSDIADSVTDAINYLPGVSANKVPSQSITIKSNNGEALHVGCKVTSDITVGQPTNDNWANWGRRIGKVAFARFNVDAALIQIDPDVGLSYKAEVEEIIGVIEGGYTLTAADVTPPETYPVIKRGIVSGLTYGNVTHIDVDGNIGMTGAEYIAQSFFGALLIKSSPPTSPYEFALHGDSGSVIIDNSTGPNKNKVLGLLFGGGGGSTYAMPIGMIFSAFKDIGPFGLGPSGVEVATDSGIITVGKPPTP